MIYLRKFETQAAYTAAESSLVLPNVSLITETNGVVYKPYVPPTPETRIVANFNVTSTSEPTRVSCIFPEMPPFDPYRDGTSGYSEIEIDGVVQPTVEYAYTFSTLGEHTVKYTLKDQTKIVNYAIYGCPNLAAVSIPSGVKSISYAALMECSNLTSITCNATIPPTLGEQVFYLTNDCPIYVPSESVDVYKAASGWSEYASRIQAIP